MPLLGNNRIHQIAFVVNDIEATSEAFAKLLGIQKPTWFLTAPHSISKAYFRGKPTNAQNKLVFIDTPSVQIELIEPNDEPSTMREFLERKEGIHHIAFDVDNMQQRVKIMEDQGFSVIQTGEFTSSKGRYVYLDTTKRYKTMIELLERDEPQGYAQPKPSLSPPLLGTDQITQLAIVVEDMEQTADAFCTLLGIEKPPVIHANDPAITQVVYRGEQTDAKAKFMFIQTPLLEIELVEPAADSPNIWNEHLDNEGEGIHHLAFVVKDLDEQIDKLKKLGYPLIQRGNFWNRKGRYAYLDTRSDLKVIIELLEKDEQ